MDPDPFLRNTFWTVSIGTVISWINSMGIHPGAVQRFVSLPTYNKARNSLIYFIIGMAVVKILTGTVGMLIYTKYKDCDPVLANVSILLYNYVYMGNSINTYWVIQGFIESNVVFSSLSRVIGIYCRIM